MFKRIDHVEIVTGNIDATLNFYQNILGFKLKERIKMDMAPLHEIVYITLGDTMVEVLAVKDPAPASTNSFQAGYRIMAIEVEDMDKAVEFLKSKGVEISRPPMSLGKSKRGEIKDNNGFTIELRQW
ncbi:MAG TPA: VOC family protein [Dehalococcoidales bacterium]|jgi:glyoxylase I family protein